MSVSPGRQVRHAVRSDPGWPQAEAVVVLGGQDHGTEAGRAGGARPLTGIEPVRVEDRRILGAVSPLAVGEGVHAEVEEHRQLVALPGELRDLTPLLPSPRCGEGDGG